MHYGRPLAWPLTSETSSGRAQAVGRSPMIHWGHSLSTHVAVWLCLRPLIIQLMSVRGWPGLTLFSIPPSLCLSGSASLSCCKKTINSWKYVTQSYRLHHHKRPYEPRKACVCHQKFFKKCIATVMRHIQFTVQQPPWCFSVLKERISIREPFAESCLVLPHAAGRAQFRDVFWAWLYHISRGGLIQQPGLLALLHLLTKRPSPGLASTALIITGAPQSVIYKSKTL